MNEKKIVPLDKVYTDDLHVVYSVDDSTAELYIRPMIDDACAARHGNRPECHEGEADHEMTDDEASATPKRSDVSSPSAEPDVYKHPGGVTIEVYPDGEHEMMYVVSFNDNSDMDKPLADRLRSRFSEATIDLDSRVENIARDLGIRSLVG